MIIAIEMWMSSKTEANEVTPTFRLKLINEDTFANQQDI